jgi:RNA polymerase sigma-70 factor (ECF subfamily)
LATAGHYTSMERRVRFELLYGEHASAVKAYILRRAQPSVADDLVAEVFMVCWRRLDKLPAEPLPWLLGVARRVLSTQRRGERRGAALHRRLAESGMPQQAGGALPPAVDSAGAALREVLEQLSESDREILLLIAWEGLSPTQAAAVLGIKAATLRVRLHRARRRLARALAREGGESLPCTPLPMEASQ